MHLLTGELVAIEEADGRVGLVDVLGARTRVALDLLPAARVGDTVLVHAGVAITIVRPQVPHEATGR